MMVKVAAAQLQIGNDMEKNYRKSIRCIEEAASAGARFLCFPEGQLSHYIPQYQGRKSVDFAIGLDHHYIEGFSEACRKSGIIASIGLCLDIGGKIYASNMLVSEKGEILAIAKKHHIVQTSHFYEQDYFTAGDEGYPVVETSIGKIGMIVCFDRHFPESFRACALKGADFIVVPVANEKIEPLEIFQWEIRIPAFQNSVNIVMCNRVGKEGRMDFCGQTVFVNADGSIASLAGDQEQLLVTQMDLSKTARLREEKQYIPLRRPEVFDL